MQRSSFEIKSEGEREERRGEFEREKRALYKDAQSERKIYELVLKYIVAYSRGFFPGKPACKPQQGERERLCVRQRKRKGERVTRLV